MGWSGSRDSLHHVEALHGGLTGARGGMFLFSPVSPANRTRQRQRSAEGECQTKDKYGRRKRQEVELAQAGRISVSFSEKQREAA